MSSFWNFCLCGDADEEPGKQQQQHGAHSGQNLNHNHEPPAYVNSMPIAQNPPMPPNHQLFADSNFIDVERPDVPPPSYTEFDPHPPGCNCPIHVNRSSRPTVIELFESQGCNSCPPTSSNLQSVMSTNYDPNMLILDYHVTYWDHLGWKDVFGQDAFNERQWDYARRRGDIRAYTPQVIVNGVAEGVGRTDDDLKNVISRGQNARKGEAWIEIEQSRRTVRLRGPKSHKGTLTVVTYDPRILVVTIRDGENIGKKLIFRNVVRRVEKIGEWTGGEQVFDLPDLEGVHEKWRQAALLQQGPGGPIIGVSKLWKGFL
jgi:hypothetical protein